MLYEAALDRSAYSLLEEYCSLPFLNTFSLADGTALALRLGHRLSYDLDLFSYQKFQVDSLDGIILWQRVRKKRKSFQCVIFYHQ